VTRAGRTDGQEAGHRLRLPGQRSRRKTGTTPARRSPASGLHPRRSRAYLPGIGVAGWPAYALAARGRASPAAGLRRDLV